MADDWDFGFASEDEVATKKVTAKSKDIDKKLTEIKQMIIPLLNNLMKNPEKDYIFWPNRIEKIQEFIDKLNAYK